MTKITREDVRPSQIQYQLLNAKLAIGNSFDSAEDAPDGVNEALAHITTAMNLLSDPDISLSDARPDDVVFERAESVHTDMLPQDWQDVAESEFVDIAHGHIVPDDIAFIFDHPELGLHGFRWRSNSFDLQSASFNRSDKEDFEESP